MFTLRLLGGASLEGPDGPVSGRAALRQRLALLALLAVEHPRPLSRDRLAAYLWPESGSDDARHLLRDSIYIVRSALGEDSVLSHGDDVRLNPERLACDFWAFEAALGRDDPRSAVAGYRGPFLNGFHFSGSGEFEEWAAAERSRLARRYVQALEQLAERESRDGHPLEAVDWWSRLVAEDPCNSRIALRYMQALDAAGDRAGALRHATVHGELLRTELAATPDAGVTALAERLRRESRAAPTQPPAPARSDTEGMGSLSSTPDAEPAKSTRRAWTLPAASALALVVGIGVLGGRLARARDPVLLPQRVAAAPFENRTGRPDLDDLGPMAADWIVRGLMDTPLFNVPDVEAVYTRGHEESTGRTDPLSLARRDSARLVIRGSYYISGDSVLFQAGIVDVASGRMRRSFDPVGAPVERATDALEALRERIAGGLSPLVNSLNRGYPVDPDLVAPPNLAAYREFLAGLRAALLGDWNIEMGHYRRAAGLDSTFVAPLIQLAFRSFQEDRCEITDSVATDLAPRRHKLTPWNRLTIDLLMANCRGKMKDAVDLLGQRYTAYPRSQSGKAHYAWSLQRGNQPRAARGILDHIVPERDLGWVVSPQQARNKYWWYMAASWHMLNGYRTELDITERWRDSAAWEWQVVRGRALSALGREREALELVGSLAGSVELVAPQSLTIATELAVHGHPGAVMTVAESVLARLERGPDTGPTRAANVVWANRLLGRRSQELDALEQMVRRDADTLAKQQAEARIAVLRADTAQAARIDSMLAERSARPLRSPQVRGAEILTRAHIAAGFDRREQAVALLREASARGMLELGSSHEFHADLLLAPLRGYPPFEALLEPDN